MNRAAAFVLVLFSGCATKSILRLEPLIPPPMTISAARLADCPVIAGQYRIVPNKKSGSKTLVSAWRAGDSFDYVSVFPFRLNDTVEISLDVPIGERDFFLRIEQESSQEITVITPNGTGSQILSSRFSTAKGDFFCENGRLVFPKRVLDLYYQTGRVNTRTISHLVRTHAGDLLYYEQTNSRGKISHWFYLFEVQKS